MTFGERIALAFDTGGHLCVGIDPHQFLLAEWGLSDSAEALRDFGLRVVEAAVGQVGIVKPQIAFFERHGAAGYRALEEVLAAARAGGLLVIADVKRGDVGTTVDAYGEAWLTPDGPLEVDAMTAVAFQGLGSLDGPHARALENGKGIFVLAATSNPEAFAVQTARLTNGKSVAESIVADVDEWNSAEIALGSTETHLGSTGVVIGATVSLSDYSIDPGLLARTPILAPGLGFQGAEFAELPARYGSATENVIAAASRSILSAGPTGIRAAIAQQASILAVALQAANPKS
jgi:orotidine-5'-phosphate decarboxylase